MTLHSIDKTHWDNLLKAGVMAGQLNLGGKQFTKKLRQPILFNILGMIKLSFPFSKKIRALKVGVPNFFMRRPAK
jgi:hypothetical protein